MEKWFRDLGSAIRYGATDGPCTPIGPRELVVTIKPFDTVDGPTFVARQANREYCEGSQIDWEPFDVEDEDDARRMASSEWFVRRIVHNGSSDLTEWYVGVSHCRENGRSFTDAIAAGPVYPDMRRTALLRRGEEIPGLDEAFMSTEEAVREEAARV